MWVAMSLDKPEGFLPDRNAHGPHLPQPSEYLIVSGPVRGVAVPGSGFSCVWPQQPVIVMILFVFPMFCLTWHRGRERAAGSLQFVLGGSCSHTQQ